MDVQMREQDGVAVPELVRRAAEAAGLGAVCGVRAERSATQTALIGAALCAIGVVVSMLVAGYNAEHTASEGHVLVPSGAVALIGITVAIRALVMGARTHYRCEAGLVTARRSAIRTVLWTDVTGMRAVKGRGGASVLAYRLGVRGARSVLLPLRTANGRDAFMDGVIAAVERHGTVVR